MNQKNRQGILRVNDQINWREDALPMFVSIGQNGLENQLDYLVREFVKEKLKTIMKEERHSFFEHEHPELKNQKNGHYTRQLDTKHGRLDDVKVPGDRDNAFQTEVFSPYQ